MNEYKLLGLGSNVGERWQQLEQAKELLSRKGVLITGASSVYETEPVDCEDGRWFFNQVVKIETTLTPLECYQACKQIEMEMGRSDMSRNAPRPIDIDLLLWEDLVVCSEELTIPHARIHGRKFVLLPLQELCPEPDLLRWLIANIHGQVVRKIS